MSPSGPRPDLHALSAQLREAIEELPADTPVRQRLQTLADQLDAGVGEPPDTSLQSAIADFEAQHPQAAETLQRIITTLSSMGL